MSNNSEYPRVLIIGQNFGTHSGGAITLSNLFKAWPKGRIAVVGYRGTLNNPDFSSCSNYYKIGYYGYEFPFPFMLISKRKNLGRISQTKHSNTSLLSGQKQNYNSLFKNTANSLLKFFGVYELVYRLTITEDYIRFINDFDPDIIYSQLSTLELIRLVKETISITNIPLALHFMDDWPITVVKRKGLFANYWNNKLTKELQFLINEAKVNLSISDQMSSAYEKRYNKRFTAFHNPVDPDFWLSAYKTEYKYEPPFRILYAGRVGKGTSTSILDIVNTTEALIVEGYQIVIEIQTRFLNHNILKTIKDKKFVKFNNQIPYAELPSKLSDMDLLLLPIDFDKKNLDFIRHSMPTKVSEYMMSGTPVLVYAPEETALSSYAKTTGSFSLANSKNKLKSELQKLIEEIDYRKSLGETSQKIAKDFHCMNIVQKKFLTALKEGI